MSYNVRFPFEQLTQLSISVSNVQNQVNDLANVITQLTQHITALENEPAYTLPLMLHSPN